MLLLLSSASRRVEPRLWPVKRGAASGFPGVGLTLQSAALLMSDMVSTRRPSAL